MRAYLPHAQVLPLAALLVTHAGIGTTIAAMRAGVPAVYLPLGRDQYSNAQAAEELGAGVTVAADASVATLRTTLADALASPDLRVTAARLRGAIAAYNDDAAAEVVELAARAQAQSELV